MKRHPNDEPVPLHTALWLDERKEQMLKGKSNGDEQKNNHL